MKKSKNKQKRYRNIMQRTSNWPQYMIKKVTGFGSSFTFKLKGFEPITVQKNMLGTFRENFFDDIYLQGFPDHVMAGMKAPTIIDIGANVGFFSLAAFFKFPNAIVYAFEPHPWCYNQLQQYQKKHNSLGWRTYQQAVSNENTTLHLTTSTVDGFATMTSVNESATNVSSFSAKAIKLDEFLEANNIENIDLIKLDCEGSEYPIIYSWPAALFQKINHLCIETHLATEENHNTKALNSYLKQAGYQTNMLDEGATGYIWAWKNQ